MGTMDFLKADLGTEEINKEGSCTRGWEQAAESAVTGRLG